jgi:hypothetical protein
VETLSSVGGTRLRIPIAVAALVLATSAGPAAAQDIEAVQPGATQLESCDEVRFDIVVHVFGDRKVSLAVPS